MAWSLGLAVGVGDFFAIRTGVPWLLSHQSSLIARGFNQGISAALAPIAWILLGMCWLAVFASFIGSYKARKLLNTRATSESLAANGSRQFELLVGESFCQGYAVEEPCLSGTDSSIDLTLRKDVHHIVVQCKQWKHQQMGVSVAIETYWLLTHYNADAAQTIWVGI
ncbi:restriction endonuclease [Xanthomonas arboricola]|uniref:restriction endonuclease n=1 Tax=Xanthomonas arboricola TaxID=56448 RepID=UPI0015E407A0|nr:restriction endonuclease [Xanthomonas arboricola]